MDNTIGAMIRHRRRELGLSQEELAERVGYSSGKSMISQVENGKINISMEKLSDFADALGCSIYELLGIHQDAYQELPADINGINLLLNESGYSILKKDGIFGIQSDQGFIALDPSDMEDIRLSAQVAAKTAVTSVLVRELTKHNGINIKVE